MDQQTVNELFKAMASTNLALQNSLGIYARNAAEALKAIQHNSAEAARLDRIEKMVAEMRGLLYEVKYLRHTKKKMKKKK